MDDIRTAFVIGVLVGVFVACACIDWAQRAELRREENREHQARRHEDDALELAGLGLADNAPVPFTLTTAGWDVIR